MRPDLSAGLRGDGLPQVFHLHKPPTNKPSVSADPRRERWTWGRHYPAEQFNQEPVSGETTFHLQPCGAQTPDTQPSERKEQGFRGGGRGKGPGSGGNEPRAGLDKAPAAQGGVSPPSPGRGPGENQATVRGVYSAAPRHRTGRHSAGSWGWVPPRTAGSSRPPGSPASKKPRQLLKVPELGMAATL